MLTILTSYAEIEKSIKRFNFNPKLLNGLTVDTYFKEKRLSLTTRVNFKRELEILVYYGDTCVWSSEYPENDIDVPVEFNDILKSSFKHTVSGLASFMVMKVERLGEYYTVCCEMMKELDTLFSFAKVCVPTYQIIKSNLVLPVGNKEMTIVFNPSRNKMSKIFPIYVIYEGVELENHCWEHLALAREVMQGYVQNREAITYWLVGILTESVKDNSYRCEATSLMMKKYLAGRD